MSEKLYESLRKLQQAPDLSSLAHINHGLEKESLRVDPSGHLAQTPHPEGLGSALTHASITTDFSEALLEFITPVFRNPINSINYLSDVHTFTYGQMRPDELLWTSSMPCVINDDDAIPLAQYGSSNIGQLKTLYRKGLGYRYGRAMQTIAGIHYNFSLPDEFWTLLRELQDSDENLQDFKTARYFDLIRNFRRASWLLLYLFGASPALCKSFVKSKTAHGLEWFDENSLYAPYATSLRMGDLGYTSKAQAGLYICHNSLNQYADGLLKAIKTPYEPYTYFKTEDGSPAQLSSCILQIENEFYSTIRPKRVTSSGIRPVKMLRDKGVEYIEVRCLDLNPFLPVGIDEEQIHFLNAFLVYCLLHSSPLTDRDETHEIDSNLQAAVRNGRDPGLELQRRGERIKLRSWAAGILEEVDAIAELLDKVQNTLVHKQAVLRQREKVEDAELTPSAKVLQRMRELKTTYFRFAMNQSLANSDYFRSLKLTEEALEAFKAQTRESFKEQARIEAADTDDFLTFLKKVNES